MKKVIAACIDRVLEFDSLKEATNYLDDLRSKRHQNLELFPVKK